MGDRTTVEVYEAKDGWRWRVCAIEGCERKYPRSRVLQRPLSTLVEVWRPTPSRCPRSPAHLFLGSNLDNIHDMVSKKRNTHHADHPKAKLTAEQVRDIRSRYSYRGVDNIVTLAAEYGLSTATVGAIIRHETWRDLA